MWPFYHGHYSHFSYQDQYIITAIEVIRCNTVTRPTREIEALTTFEAIQTLMSITANMAMKVVMELTTIMTISITAFISNICDKV